MLSKLGYVLTVCAGIVACSTQAQRQAAEMQSALERAQQAQQACLAQVRSDPVVAEVLTYIVLNEDDSNKLAKLSDTRHVDQKMRNDLIHAQQKIIPCRSAAKNAYSAVHPAIGEVISATYAAQDRVLLALVNGWATIGEANQASLHIDQLSQQAWNEANITIGQQLADAHAQEMQNRQAAALALQQYSLQQQMIDSMNKPRTTNCTAFGNTLNCNSF